MFNKSKQYRYLFTHVAFVVGFLLFSLTINNILIAKAEPAPPPKCPDQITYAPNGNLQECKPNTWTIRCFIKQNKIAAYSTTNPEGNDCPMILKQYMADTTCFALTPTDGSADGSNNPELIPCPDNKEDWDIECFVGTNGSYEKLDNCPATFWEYANSGRCYVIPPDSESRVLKEDEIRENCAKLYPGSTDVFVCNDKSTVLPKNPGQRFNPNDYCASHGGYSEQTRRTCIDGVTLPPPTGGVSAADFCEDFGGYTPASSENETNVGIQPQGGDAILETDCNVSTETEAISAENCGIIRILIAGINTLSVLAGMVIIGSIMMGGYQYMTAQDNSGQVQAAKKRILWAFIALALFIFMYAFLDWVVPGGVL